MNLLSNAHSRVYQRAGVGGLAQRTAVPPHIHPRTALCALPLFALRSTCMLKSKAFVCKYTGACMYIQHTRNTHMIATYCHAARPYLLTNASVSVCLQCPQLHRPHQKKIACSVRIHISVKNGTLHSKCNNIRK